MGEVDRIKTGIKGLDELIAGGVPKGSTVLITGGPGTGKSTFGLNFLVNGALKYNEPGLYVSLEEEAERLIKNVKSTFDWPLDELIKKKMLKILKAELYDFEKLKMTIENEVESRNVQRLVIDPSTVIGLYFENPLQIRRSMLELDKLLKKLGCTTFMICEVPEGHQGISVFGVEEFTADGIIILYYVREGNVFIRAMTVRKMRATEHDKTIHPMGITKDGVVVYPTSKVFKTLSE